MKYNYEDLSETQFENLIVCLCQELFGLGMQGFAPGPDGGRDGSFVGTADKFPSNSAPWQGQIVIQAKHTNGYNNKFSDVDFFSFKEDSGKIITKNINSVIDKEVPRILNLIRSGKLTHYILFSNRKLTAMSQANIIDYISQECGLSKSCIYLCGIEQLDAYFSLFPRIVSLANLNPYDAPIIISPDEIALVVTHLAKQFKEIIKYEPDPPVPRVSYETKNKLNNMSEEYASEFRRLYLKDVSIIKSFLANPENEAILRNYEEAVEDFQLKIIAKRSDYDKFDDVINYIFNFLFGRDNELANNKRLTRAVVFYMYWNCDIGKDDYNDTP